MEEEVGSEGMVGVFQRDCCFGEDWKWLRCWRKSDTEIKKKRSFSFQKGKEEMETHREARFFRFPMDEGMVPLRLLL